MDLTAIRDICMEYQGCAKEYYTGVIPERKLAGAKTIASTGNPDQVLAAIDCTVFGSCTDGIAIASNGIHWKNIADSKPSYISWDQIKNIEFKEEKTLLSKQINLSDGKIIELSGASDLCRRENQSLSKLLYALKDVVLNLPPTAERIDSTTTTAVSQSNTSITTINGFTECEYCGLMIKPYSVFCKHCGIKVGG